MKPKFKAGDKVVRIGWEKSNYGTGGNTLAHEEFNRESILTVRSISHLNYGNNRGYYLAFDEVVWGDFEECFQLSVYGPKTELETVMDD